jgi:hypothetical protein
MISDGWSAVATLHRLVKDLNRSLESWQIGRSSS